MRRLLAGGALAAALVLVLAAPAFAHATLESTDPAAGVAVGRSPRSVSLRFSEPVEVSLGAIRLYDSDGKRLDTGRPGHVGGDSATVAVTAPKLDDGAYVVTWRVISADSHPVHGAFSFRVGTAAAGTDTSGLAEQLLSAGGGSRAVGVLAAVVRFAVFAGLIVLVGGTVFVLLCWPAGAADPRLRRLLWTALGVTLVATLVGIPLQGVYAGGLPFGDIVKPSVIGDVLPTRLGRASVMRALLLAALAVPLLQLLLAHAGRRIAPGLAAAAGLVGGALLVTPGLSGHASIGSPVAGHLAVDLVHLAAASVWVGGLVAATVALLPRREVAELRDALPRFSRLAFGAVVVVVATGVAQSWRQVGSIDALRSTPYGHLLIVKVVTVAVLVALGGMSRRWLQERLVVAPADRPLVAAGPGAAVADPAAASVNRLRASVGLEVVVAAVILAVTSLLVNAQPATSALRRPFSTELRSGPLLIDVVVDPAKVGPAQVHFYTLSPEGAVKDVAEMKAQLTLPSRGIGPITVPLTRAGPGHFVATRVDLPIAGRWRLDVRARLTEIDQAAAHTEFTVH